MNGIFLDPVTPRNQSYNVTDLAADVIDIGRGESILDVSAKDTATGKSQSIRITGSTRLREDEKQRMVEEAERYAEAVCYQAEKTLADFGEQLAADLRQRIESALRDTRDALTHHEVALATERAEALKKILQEAGGVLYAQASQATAQPSSRESASAPSNETDSRERVVDAQYREV